MYKGLGRIRKGKRKKTNENGKPLALQSTQRAASASSALRCASESCASNASTPHPRVVLECFGHTAVSAIFCVFQGFQELAIMATVYCDLKPSRENQLETSTVREMFWEHHLSP